MSALSQRIARARRAGKAARPTSGKVLLALLSILDASGHLDGARFLDLFSGTGQVSLAMLERGAASALAVESERDRASAISTALARNGYESAARSLCGDVRRVLPRLARGGEHFDVIFADPPYSLGWGQRLIALMGENWGILAENGVFVFEHALREELPPLACETGSESSPFRSLILNCYQTVAREDRIYGDTVLSLYWNGRRII